MAQVLELVQAVARPRVADEAAAHAVLPVVEGNVGIEVGANPAAVLVVGASVEGDVGLTDELVGAAFGGIQLVNHKGALSRTVEIEGGVAVLQGKVDAAGHAGEGGAGSYKVSKRQVVGVEEAFADGDGHVRPAHESAAVDGFIELLMQVAGKGAAFYNQ